MTTDSQSQSESPGGNPSPDNGRGTFPASIGKYRIERKLGEGGMGTVYLAFDAELKRLVALKVLRRERADNPTLVKRFHAEAKTAGTLEHENIVSVYEAGQLDGYTFIAMEFVDGIDVHDLVQRREVIPVRRSIDIIKQVASALQHAYERGVVHRDIKPSNLLIQRDGTVKLADLGLARLVDEDSEAGITRDGTTVGTVDYMSPEQARSSRRADTRSDIYSLGCAWYHMLTGEPPYADGGITQRLRLHAEGKPPDPRELNPKVPEGVVAILNRMMAKNPNDRYRTPAEVLAELEKVNLQRSIVAGEILAELNENEKPPKPSVNSRKNAAPLPARDPRFASQDSSAAIIFPMRLAGTVIVGITLLALAVYGWSRWEGSSSAEPVNVDLTDDPAEMRDPFAIDEGPVAVPGKEQDPPPGHPQNNKPPQKTPPADRSSAANAPNGDPVARVEPTHVTPAERKQSHKPYLPNWAERSAVESGRKQLVTTTVALPANVGPNARPPTVSLKTRLDNLPAAGGILQLPGRGPYELNLAQLRKHRHVVIKPGGRDRPAVFIRQQSGRPSALDVSAEVLELDGLDLFFQTADNVSQQPAVAIHVSTGDLFVRNCALQVVGNSPAAVVAFQVDRPPSGGLAAATRVLIDRTAIVGPNLTALSVDADSADVVIRESLLVAGSAAAMQLKQMRATATTSHRSLRLIGDTIVSGSHAVELINGLSVGDVAPTHIIAVDSIFANADAIAAASMLALQNWPQTARRLDNLNWESVGSAYQGWPRLVQNKKSGIEETFAADFTDWKPLWPIPGEEAQFHPTAWPTSTSDVLRSPNLKLFAPETLPNPLAISLLGDRPGCRLENLHLGTPPTSGETRDIPPRPAFPGGVATEFENAETIPVDLTKQDLGRFLSKTKLPPRVVILAEGFGRRQITPFSISDRAVRIEFRQKGGDSPLTLVAATKSRRSGQETTADALMTVSGGQLEIAGGFFEMSAAPNRPNLDWFLDVRNGGFTIEQCHIASLPGDDPRKPGLIRWQHVAAGVTAGPPQIGVIRDSFLCTGGTLIQAQMRHRQLFIDNAILASPGILFSLDVGGAPTEPPGSVVLQDSTLSAATYFFDIETDNPHDSPRVSLGFFADRTIFGAPLHSGAETLAPVLFHKGSGIAPRQLAWIGDHNGYSDEIKKFVAIDTAASADASSFESGWMDFWGRENIRAPLTKPGGVLFAAPLPTLEQLRPDQFTLHRSAEANAWGGKRLGANPAKIVALSPQKSSTTSGAKTSAKSGF